MKMDYDSIGGICVWYLHGVGMELEVQYDPKRRSWRYFYTVEDAILGQSEDKEITFNSADRMFGLPMKFTDPDGHEYYPE